MTDKTIITIDCDSNTVNACIEDGIDFSDLGAHPVETLKSDLVARCLIPEIRRLMALTKDELMAETLLQMEKNQG